MHNPNEFEFDDTQPDHYSEPSSTHDIFHDEELDLPVGDNLIISTNQSDIELIGGEFNTVQYKKIITLIDTVETDRKLESKKKNTIRAFNQMITNGLEFGNLTLGLITIGNKYITYKRELIDLTRNNYTIEIDYCRKKLTETEDFRGSHDVYRSDIKSREKAIEILQVTEQLVNDFEKYITQLQEKPLGIYEYGVVTKYLTKLTKNLDNDGEGENENESAQEDDYEKKLIETLSTIQSLGLYRTFQTGYSNLNKLKDTLLNKVNDLKKTKSQIRSDIKTINDQKFDKQDENDEDASESNIGMIKTFEDEILRLEENIKELKLSLHEMNVFSNFLTIEKNKYKKEFGSYTNTVQFIGDSSKNLFNTLKGLSIQTYIITALLSAIIIYVSYNLDTIIHSYDDNLDKNIDTETSEGEILISFEQFENLFKTNNNDGVKEFEIIVGEKQYNGIIKSQVNGDDKRIVITTGQGEGEIESIILLSKGELLINDINHSQIVIKRIIELYN